MNALVVARGASSWSLFPTRVNFVVAIYYLWMGVLPFLRPLFSHGDAGAFLGFIPFNLFLATITAGTAREIAALPFSHALPARQHVLRRQLLTIAVMGNALFIAPMLLFPAATMAARVGAICACFLAGISLYIGTAVLLFRLRDATLLIGPAVLAGLLLLMPPRNFAATAVALQIAGNPLLWLLLAVLVLWPFWQLFDDKERFRRLSGSRWIGFVDSMDVQKYRAFKQGLAIDGRLHAPDSRWYRWLTDQSRGASGGWLACFRQQCVCRLASLASTATLSGVVQGVVLATGLVVLLGYFRDRVELGHFQLFLNMMFSVRMFYLAPVTSHNPSLPYSRRAMAVAELLLGLGSGALCVLAGAAVLALCGSFGLLGQAAPAVPAAVGFAALLLPLYLAARLLFGAGAGFLLVMVQVAAMILSRTLLDNYQQAGIGMQLLLHGGGWVLWMPVIYWYYCRRDLVANDARAP